MTLSEPNVLYASLDHQLFDSIPKSVDLALDFFGLPGSNACSNDGS